MASKTERSFTAKRKIIKFSNTSRGVVIPKIFCDAYGIEMGDSVVLIGVDDGILIKIK